MKKVLGQYLASPTSGMLTTSPNGNDQIAITFNVTAINSQGVWEALLQPINRIVFLSTNGASWEKYSRLRMEQLGWNNDADNMRFDCESVVLEEFEDTYNGKTRTKWQIFSDGGMDLKPADTSALARFKALLAQSAKQAGGTAPTSKPVNIPAPSAPSAPPAPASAPAPSAPAPSAPAPSAPAPSAPAPSAPAPSAPAPSAPATRSGAWASYVSTCQQARLTPKLPIFQEECAKIGKVDADFTPPAWAIVISEATGLPF